MMNSPAAINSVTHAYDNNGNLTSAGGTIYGWDYRNQLTGIGDGVSTSTTYNYDFERNRVKKTVNNVTSFYPNKYFSTSSATTTKNIYAGDVLVATVEKVGTATTTHIVHPDHLGGTNVVTDANGDVVQTLDYYPYGTERISTETTAFDQQRKFIGEVADAESGLNYLNARYYANTKGQFLSQDPVFWEDPRSQALADPQQLNSYSYARGNPINEKDPNGKCVDACVAELTILTAPVWIPIVGAALYYSTQGIYDASLDLSKAIRQRWTARREPNVGLPAPPSIGNTEPPNGNPNLKWIPWVVLGASVVDRVVEFYAAKE